MQTVEVTYTNVLDFCKISNELGPFEAVDELVVYYGNPDWAEGTEMAEIADSTATERGDGDFYMCGNRVYEYRYVDTDEVVDWITRTSNEDETTTMVANPTIDLLETSVLVYESVSLETYPEIELSSDPFYLSVECPTTPYYEIGDRVTITKFFWELDSGT